MGGWMRVGTVLAEFASLLFVFQLLPTAAVGQSRLPPCPTVSSEKWDNCQGTKTFTGNWYTKYVGEFRNGNPNGQGTLTSATGSMIYVGNVKDGRAIGQGTLTFFAGKEGPAKIVGEFNDNRVKGTKTYNNGDIYVGEFKDGKLNGQGTLTWRDGTKFVGEFTDDRLNGQATKTFPNGAKYVGEVKNAELNGQGTFTFANGDEYVGQFKGGQFNGNGTLRYANGNIYVGEFKDGKAWSGGQFLGEAAEQKAIRMEQSGGVYVVPVRFNDVITLNAIVDSGAADVSIPADIVLTLIRTKTITDEDFLGKQIYVLADGSKVPSQRLRIRSLQIGNKTVKDVVGSIASVKGEILLGQSFLRKFKSWSVDNEQHTLMLR